MYVELKTGFADNGPAWIGWVRFSRSGRSVYYHGRMLQRLGGQGVEGGNYFDAETGEEFWVSGVKKDRQDRHPSGSGDVDIDDDATEEYARIVGSR